MSSEFSTSLFNTELTTIHFFLIADGFQWEEGPNSFQPSDHILRFAKDLGLIEELILANASLPRFVYWDNQLIALPASLGELCSLKLLGCKNF